jgi:hypothetical protein
MTNTIPIGVKRSPMMSNAVLAVMIGCQAGKRCCLNTMSKHNTNVEQTDINTIEMETDLLEDDSSVRHRFQEVKSHSKPFATKRNEFFKKQKSWSLSLEHIYIEKES